DALIAGDTIRSDESWDADTVLITSDIYIPSGITLTIPGGTYVISEGRNGIIINGAISAGGYQSDSVFFTASDTSEGWTGFTVKNNALSSDTADFSYCVFSHCQLEDDQIYGGAFTLEPGSKTRIHRSLIRKCVSVYGGAIYADSADLIITGCTFRKDSASDGGAIYIENTSDILIENNHFYLNKASSEGGAIFVKAGSPLIRNNIFDSNSAGLHGGGLYLDSGTDIINCLFTGNSSVGSSGGALYSAWNSGPRIINCTFTKNNAPSGSSILLYYSSASIIGCIIWGNTSSDTSLKNISSSPSILYSCLQDSITGTGNIYSDPLFSDISVEDFSIGENSPCVDGGPSDTSGLRFPEFDLLLNTRIRNDRPDMGAYEYQPPALIGTKVDLPLKLELLRNYPNPFNPSTIIPVNIPLESSGKSCHIEIRDVKGRKIRKIFNGVPDPGSHKFIWRGINEKGKAVPGGIYIISVSIDGKNFKKKCLLLK
ncbi:MAG: right-handed parallel beta-helix repeat-containing protein, partial [Fibrobacterota bacterium]